MCVFLISISNTSVTAVNTHFCTRHQTCIVLSVLVYRPQPLSRSHCSPPRACLREGHQARATAFFNCTIQQAVSSFCPTERGKTCRWWNTVALSHHLTDGREKKKKNLYIYIYIKKSSLFLQEGRRRGCTSTEYVHYQVLALISDLKLPQKQQTM